MKSNWKEQAFIAQQKATALVKDLTKNYREDPDVLAELVAFQSRFYKYSIRNVQLIYAQNPNATYVQSFNAWKKMVSIDEKISVLAGESGIKIWVPVKVTFLKIGNKYVQYKNASKEQQDAYKKGVIEGIQEQRFKLGTVFDISQTNYPKEKYPQLFQMGYPSEQHAEIIKGLEDFSLNYLQSKVTYETVHSIALRGWHEVGGDTVINDKLEDTEKLSTIVHEIGHDILKHGLREEKSSAQEEFEADAFSIMLDTHFGVDITDGRKRHLYQAYQQLEQEWILLFEDQREEHEKEELDDYISGHMDMVLADVQDIFSSHIEEIDECVDQYVSVNKKRMQEREMQEMSMYQMLNNYMRYSGQDLDVGKR